VLEPVDDLPLPEILPGEYVSMFVNLRDGDHQPRQYTVSLTAVVRDSRSPFGGCSAADRKAQCADTATA
jgi:hypothetical protein